MDKLVYLGKDPFSFIRRLSKSFVVTYIEDYCENPIKDCLFYFDGDEKAMDLVPRGSILLYGKKHRPDFEKYRHLFFTKDQKERWPVYKNIGLKGDQKLMDRFVQYFCQKYRTSIKLWGDFWIKKYYSQQNLLEKHSVFVSQLSFSLEGNLSLSFDERPCDLTLFFWKGDLQELYKWKEKNRREPVFIFCERKRDVEKGKSIVRGIFIKRKASMDKNWKEVVKIPIS